jgi:hypothetical protein
VEILIRAKMFFIEKNDKETKDFFLCNIRHDFSTDEPYYAPEFFYWDTLEENGLGWRKNVVVNYLDNKESVHEKLVQLYPRLRECQQKYYICVTRGGRSQELRMVNVGPASGTTITVIFYTQFFSFQLLISIFLC